MKIKIEVNLDIFDLFCHDCLRVPSCIDDYVLEENINQELVGLDWFLRSPSDTGGRCWRLYNYHNGDVAPDMRIYTTMEARQEIARLAPKVFPILDALNRKVCRLP